MKNKHRIKIPLWFFPWGWQELNDPKYPMDNDSNGIDFRYRQDYWSPRFLIPTTLNNFRSSWYKRWYRKWKRTPRGRQVHYPATLMEHRGHYNLKEDIPKKVIWKQIMSHLNYAVPAILECDVKVQYRPWNNHEIGAVLLFKHQSDAMLFKLRYPDSCK